MEAIARFFNETFGDQESALYKALVKKKTYLSGIKNSAVDTIRREVLRQFPVLGGAPKEIEIAGKLGMTAQVVGEALNELAQFDLLTLNDHGVIISAYPFSHVPTSHKVTLEDGRSVWALCAVDALGVSSMLKAPVTVTSTCFHCDAPIGITVNDARLIAKTPAGIYVWLSTKESCGCTARTMCPLINFFCSAAHLKEWREANRDEAGYALTLDQALKAGYLIFSDFLD